MSLHLNAIVLVPVFPMLRGIANEDCTEEAVSTRPTPDSFIRDPRLSIPTVTAPLAFRTPGSTLGLWETVALPSSD